MGPLPSIHRFQFNMRPSFKISDHAIKKHLDASNLDASVFFNRRVMYQSVQKCLDRPDKVKICGKRTEVTKTFNYDIGILAYSDSATNKIRVVCTRTKHVLFIVTAYPIA